MQNINDSLIVLKRDGNFCLTFNRKTKVVNLCGTNVFTFSAWSWLFDFQDLNEKYKPPCTFYINNDLILENTGVLKTTSDISNKVVSINVSWNVNK